MNDSDIQRLILESRELAAQTRELLEQHSQRAALLKTKLEQLKKEISVHRKNRRKK